MVQTINNNNYNDIMTANTLPVFIDFFADWCAPCRMMSPVVEEMAKQYEGRVLVCKCNTEDAPELAERFNIRSIPTFVFMKDLEVVDRHTGVIGEIDLSRRLDALL